MSLPAVIAVSAILTYTAAALGNAWLLWRYRPYGSISAVAIGVIGLAAWIIAGYALLLLGVFPDADPPINVVMLRPAQSASGILWALNAAAMATAIQRYGLTVDMREAVTEAEKWRLELGKCRAELDRQTQLANMSARVVRGQEEKMLEQTGKINTLERRIRELERERGRK